MMAALRRLFTGPERAEIAELRGLVAGLCMDLARANRNYEALLKRWRDREPPPPSSSGS